MSKADVIEAQTEDLRILKEYTEAGRLAPDFFPLMSYELIQSGYPTPTRGQMIARPWGGTDAEGRLINSDGGQFCKVEDVKAHLRRLAEAKAREFLERPKWPEGLEARKHYERTEDDSDARIAVVLGDDGDAWVSIIGARPCSGLRFRTLAGGGSSLRTRAALLLLAEAIRLDNEERK